MIITCKKRVPFRWIAFAILPWTSYSFNGQVMSVALLFSLKKFVENPAGLTFVLSLPGFVSILLVPIANFLSDRVWTRFGRRKPFIATGWAGIAIAMALMPLMPNFWCLLAVYLLYSMFNDIGGQQGPMEPLSQEIVPPHQRGRANGAMSWCANLACMTFYFFALGRFDDVRFMAGVPLDGEKAIYWIAGMLVLLMLAFLTLGVKELDQKSPFRGQRLNLRNFFSGIFDRDLWPVFMLMFSYAMFNSSLGPLGNLLYTDQWNYTKQEMGVNVVIGGIINMFIIAFLAIIADKLNRMRAYQTLICIALFVKASYFCYVNFVLADRRPSLVELVVFGETLSIVGILIGMVYTPLVYDYVTRNKMGTYMAGAGLLNRVTALLTLNGVGVFVWAYAHFSQPPAGDMVRVVLRDDMPKTEVRELVRQSQWKDPETGATVGPAGIQANPWYATGLVLNHGRCWELRLRDNDSEKLAAEKEGLEKHRSPLITEEKMIRDKADALKAAGKPADAVLQKADAEKKQIDQLTEAIKKVDAGLASRAENLRKQAVANFDGKILVDGDQILDAGMHDALVIKLPTKLRPDGEHLDKILRELRLERPEVIDLRPLKRHSGYGITASAILPANADESAFAKDLQAALERVAAKKEPGFLEAGSAILEQTRVRALEMKLRIIEEPLDTRISPIMRIVHGIQAFFGSPFHSDHRLIAIARNLRLSGESEHVRVSPGADNDNLITATAILAPTATQAAPTGDLIESRLANLLSNDKELVPQAKAFYDRVELAAASKRITIARPFVGAAYAPLKYDYMCGYLWMFMLGLVGLAITFLFQRRERMGLIHKKGVEEAAREPEDTGLAEPSGFIDTPATPHYYTPGHAKRKLLVIAFGCALFIAGLFEMRTPLHLWLSGGRAVSEAFRVIKTKPGTPNVILANDLEIRQKQEKRDRSYTFWNEFRFKTQDGRDMIVRCPVGSKMKPLYPLIDEDGLPSSLTVWYNVKHPGIVAFPAIFSTWFAPASLAILGLAFVVIGGFLFYWSNKPIELPRLTPVREEALVAAPPGA